MRLLFVLILTLGGGLYALQGPFQALVFYLANAYFRPEQWVWDQGLVVSLRLSMISGCYLVFITLVSGQRFVMNYRIVMLLAFLFHTFLSCFSSSHYAAIHGAWTNFFQCIVITFIMVTVVDNFAKLRMIFLVITIFLGFEGAKQGWTYLITNPSWGANPNEYAFFGDNNGVAVGMLMLTPLIGLLIQTTDTRWKRGFYIVVLIGVIYRALSTFSRGAFLALLAVSGVYWWRSQHKVRSLLAILLLAAILLPCLPTSFWERMETIQTYEEEDEKSAVSRFHFWKVAFLMAQANPLFGVGHNAYNFAYNTYDFSRGQYGTRRSVHSAHFGILAEQGFPGFLLYVLNVFAAWRSCAYTCKLLRQTTYSPELYHAAQALQVGLTAYLVGSTFLPFQYNEMFWHFLGLTIIVENLAEQHVRDSLESQEMIDVAPTLVTVTDEKV